MCRGVCKNSDNKRLSFFMVRILTCHNRKSSDGSKNINDGSAVGEHTRYQEQNQFSTVELHAVTAFVYNFLFYFMRCQPGDILFV